MTRSVATDSCSQSLPQCPIRPPPCQNRNLNHCSPDEMELTPMKTSSSRLENIQQSVNQSQLVLRFWPTCSPISSKKPQGCTTWKKSTRGRTVLPGIRGSKRPTRAFQERNTLEEGRNNFLGITTMEPFPTPCTAIHWCC